MFERRNQENIKMANMMFSNKAKCPSLCDENYLKITSAEVRRLFLHHLVARRLHKLVRVRRAGELEAQRATGYLILCCRFREENDSLAQGPGDENDLGKKCPSAERDLGENLGANTYHAPGRAETFSFRAYLKGKSCQQQCS